MHCIHRFFAHGLVATLSFPICISNLCSAYPLTALDDLANATEPPEPEPTYVAYVSDPNGRGTPTLVLSCLLTLILCVWSALHLNVPRQGERPIQTLFIYARWILTGVFGPELVAFTAWRQWCSARLVNNLAAQMKPGSRHSMAEAQEKVENRHKWTMTHSFFASAGGFAFNLKSLMGDSAQFLPDDCPSRLTLTARGMALLIKCGLVPEISAEDILDKSKSNNLAKALVLIQALWMLLQAIGRLIADLPVTLLEVNTVAHVLCLLLVYLMWWNKPLSPNEPIILIGDWVAPLCAFMFMCSEISGTFQTDVVESETAVKTLLASMHLYSKHPEIERMAFVQKRVPLAASSDIQQTTNQEPRTSSERDLIMAEDLRELQMASASSLAQSESYKEKLRRGTTFFERRPRTKEHRSPSTAGDATTRSRWELASEAIRAYPALLSEYVLLEQSGDSHFEPQEFLVAHVQNWPWDDLLRSVDGFIVGIILWMASFVYGAIHAAAWDDYFPTEVERWLWRASSVYIAFCGGLWIFVNWLARSWGPLDAFWERWVNGGAHWVSYLLLGPLVLVCGSSFLLARGFIVVEAFASVRNLPLAAYDTPNWSQIFPHF